MTVTDPRDSQLWQLRDCLALARTYVEIHRCDAKVCQKQKRDLLLRIDRLLEDEREVTRNA